jgi:hypothetical protein
MKASPSDAWFDVFPGPRIPQILAYVAETWGWLHQVFAAAVSFDRDETELTDNLCEALEDRDRRRAYGLDCDFQPETWELRRGADGRVTRIARADIRVMLGAPGTPHLVIEFKKLDGSADGRWRYCFDGINRSSKANTRSAMRTASCAASARVTWPLKRESWRRTLLRENTRVDSVVLPMLPAT